MIGDTATDIKTAINAGAISIGVLWGYRAKEELLEAGADHIVDSVGTLNVYLQGCKKFLWHRFVLFF